MQISITKEELYSLIKDAVREVIREKEIHLFLGSIPEVSEEEMKDIEDLYGSPDKYTDVAHSELIDI
jgi:hypothetical protein